MAMATVKKKKAKMATWLPARPSSTAWNIERARRRPA